MNLKHSLMKEKMFPKRHYKDKTLKNLEIGIPNYKKYTCLYILCKYKHQTMLLSWIYHNYWPQRGFSCGVNLIHKKITWISWHIVCLELPLVPSKKRDPIHHSYNKFLSQIFVKSIISLYSIVLTWRVINSPHINPFSVVCCEFYSDIHINAQCRCSKMNRKTSNFCVNIQINIKH